jgi:hypothetical protein
MAHKVAGLLAVLALAVACGGGSRADGTSPNHGNGSAAEAAGAAADDTSTSSAGSSTTTPQDVSEPSSATGGAQPEDTSEPSSGTGGTHPQDTSEPSSGTGGSTAGTGGTTSGTGGAAPDDLDESSGGTAGTAPTEPLAYVLKTVTSCDELNTQLREKRRREMNETLDAQAEQVKTNPRGQCGYGGRGAGGATGWGGASSTPTNGGDTSAPTSVSETNNQVADVDEADLVKTDGQYLYLAQDAELRIVDAWPAAEARAVSTTPLDGAATRLFVLGDRALVYVSIPRAGMEGSDWLQTSASDCTYGYDCDFSGDGSATEVVILDVSDRASPKILRKLEFAGSLIAARRIGATVHTVVSIGEVGIMGLVYPNLSQLLCNTTDLAAAQEEALAAIEQAREDNEKFLDEASFDIGVLASEDGRALGASDCSDFYRELAGDGTGVTTLASLDLSKDDDPKLANIFSRAGAVYASADALLMATPHQQSGMPYWYEGMAADEASTVHQFAIGEAPETTLYLGSGIVAGHVLNQFSMDVYDGYLRIATSKGRVPDPDVESVVSVLELKDGALGIVGQVDGIGPKEDIRSVRFDGKRGYLVTFEKTDPLFVLDLSDPRAPAVVGELKIPGFSTYMHLLDDSHLLALGYEADDQGEFSYFNGIQLQIFDVTDATQPSLLHKKVYGTRGSSSSALTDHLGFTYLPDRGLLTLPMSICDGGGDGQYGTLSFSGVVALDVSMEDGFTELGRLEEPYPTGDTQFYYGAACADWWTDSNSVVDRTVVLDQFLYAISENRVRVQDLGNLGVDVKVVDFDG